MAKLVACLVLLICAATVLAVLDLPIPDYPTLPTGYCRLESVLHDESMCGDSGWEYAMEDLPFAVRAWANITSISIDKYDATSIAVREDGSFVYSGTFGAGSYRPKRLTALASEMTNVVKAATTDAGTVLLLDNGTIVVDNCWNKTFPADVTGDVIDVAMTASGSATFYVLLANSTVLAWTPLFDTFTAKSDIPNLVSIVTGSCAFWDGQVCGISDDGLGTTNGSCWGCVGCAGGCDVPAGLTTVVKMIPGNAVNYALLANGTLLRGDGVVKAHGVRDYATTSYVEFIVYSNGTFACNALIIMSGEQCVQEPYTQTISGDDIVSIAAGWQSVIVLLADGHTVGFHADVPSTPGPTFNENKFPDYWAIPYALYASGYQAWDSRIGYTVGIMPDYSLFAWGTNSEWQSSPPTNISDVVMVSPSGSHCLALLHNGTVLAWGSNVSGQAIVPGDLAPVVAVAASSEFSLMLFTNGTPVVWGNYYNDGNPVVLPADLEDVIAIDSGYDFAAFLLSNHTMRVVTGSGVADDDLLQPPAGLTNVQKMCASASFIVALFENGSIIAWGRDDGFYGNHVLVYNTSTLPLATDVVCPRADYDSPYALAILENQTAVIWGGLSNSALSDALPELVTAVPTWQNIVGLTGAGQYVIATICDPITTAPPITTTTPTTPAATTTTTPIPTPTLSPHWIATVAIISTFGGIVGLVVVVAALAGLASIANAQSSFGKDD